MPSLAFKIIEGTRSAGQSIFAHGFRSFLTTLGIIIGVASVIAVVSVVQGFSASISQEFDGMGTNVINIDSYTPRKARLQGVNAKLSYDDFLEIKHKVKGRTDKRRILTDNFNELTEEKEREFLKRQLADKTDLRPTN